MIHFRRVDLCPEKRTALCTLHISQDSALRQSQMMAMSLSKIQEMPSGNRITLSVKSFFWKRIMNYRVGSCFSKRVSLRAGSFFPEIFF